MARIVQFHRAGGPEVLEFADWEDPAPKSDEVLIRVRALGLNRADAMWREDAYVEAARFPARIGYELGGVVEAVGANVRHVAVGEAVNTLPLFSLNDYGMYGDLVVAPSHAVVSQPEGLTFEEGASVWVMFLTAYGMLVETLDAKPGDVVVITAASSSVGLAAIQVARARGAIPIAVTRTREKEQRLLEAGAAHVVRSEEQDVAAEIARLSGGKGATIVVDPVGGPLAAQLVDALAPGGTLLLYGDLSRKPVPLTALTLVGRQITVRGFTLDPLAGSTGELKAANMNFIVEGLASGKLRPAIDRSFPFDRIVDAHRHLESNGHFGKIVVTL